MSEKMLSPRVRSPNLQSPTGQRTAQLSSAPPKKFDPDQLRSYMKKLLPSTLQGMVWDSKDRDQSKAWTKEIGDRVKARMLEIEPSGFKYVVTTQINENLGQGGRAGLVCHWEDSDACIQEMYTNDSLICICIAFAIRIP
ncbi:unnamed protein product [Rhizoctonia solani]|uniref:Topoisomerase I damage affected protein 2 n=1 Tax=Rhizoctonia solani TaxID=456999 RepID=A0A8H3D749_9AGAM|nr:unnamed protein product [Rhizoctonia solani]CAE6510723.1 unnamed protein product [Rhizoctonia solani]